MATVAAAKNSRPDGLPKRVRISFKYLRDNGNSCSVFYPSVQKGTSFKRVVFTGNYSVGLLSVLYNMLCHLCHMVFPMLLKNAYWCYDLVFTIRFFTTMVLPDIFKVSRGLEYFVSSLSILSYSIIFFCPASDLLKIQKHVP
jgi:hypothetical protein